MKTCFIYPTITRCGFNSFGNPYFGMESCYVHHGLCSLSASIKQAGFFAELIDLRKMRNWGHFRKELKSRNPDVFAATVWGVDYNIALKSLRIAKELNPRVIVVVGGVYPTVVPEALVGQKDIDYIVRGEGELALVKLLRNLEAGKSVERVIEGERPDLDELPFIDRELFDYKAELNSPCLGEYSGLEPPFVTILTSRGCKYNCSFCQPTQRMIFGRQVRQRSVENVMAELKQLRDKYHFKSFMIYDDTFIQDVDWVREFCHQYRANGFTQPFWAETRADIVCKQEKIIAELSRTGLSALAIGFESGNDRVLKLLKKGVTVEQNYRAAEICQKYGIRFQGGFMFGIPGETNAEMMDTVRMIKRIKPKFFHTAVYTPYRGAALTEHCRQGNLILIDDYAKYNPARPISIIKGVDYPFAAHAIEEALGFSWAEKILYRLQKVGFIEQILKRLVKRQPFKGLILWLRGALEARVISQVGRKRGLI
ncbi:B12-binding domain-containing radical SAM protein [Chloroflexota bacterium]